MDSHHRKIDLQSPADLTYLLNNIKNAAQQKIDLAIPRSAAPQGEDDAYRTKVEELVQDYITRTLLLALPNLSINGFDASPSLISHPPFTDPTKHHANAKTSSTDPAQSSTHISDAELSSGNYESYDPRLAERLRALYVQFEHEAEDVARMRRDVPGKAAERYKEELERAMEETSKIKIEEGSEQKGKGDAFEGLGGLGERREDVEKVFQRGRVGLEGFEGFTGVIARLEQAGRAVEVVEGRG